ncbi:MAG: formylglycine-generating enzyme family protein [Pseudomonadales bacterium]|nr:formylglycine-generating enzyme family protein [Pseudomonadales bacterium]
MSNYQITRLPDVISLSIDWDAVRTFFLLSLISLCCLAASTVQANTAIAWKDKYINPKPQADDVIIPMPCGGGMAFRKVEVPSESPLADYGVTLGQESADWGYVEHARPAFIAGSFSNTAKDARYYLMAKYEISDLQYDAVMSEQCAKASMRKLLPKVSVSWHEALAFANRYNLWLRQNKLAEIPSEDGSIGFLRLPTETEWEFAARGGLSVTQSQFRDTTFPVPEGLNQYAWFAGPTSSNGKLNLVGRLNPNPLGLHDMLGNVEEIMLEPFRLNKLNRFHGQFGGFVVRGGNYLTPLSEIRTSLRQEKSYYQEQNMNTSKTMGFRLVMVANSLTSRDRVLAIEKDWQSLGVAPVAQGPNPMKDLADMQSDVKDQGLQKKLKKLEAELRANAQTRDEQMKRAIRSNLRLGAFLCTKLQDDGKFVDLMAKRFHRDCSAADAADTRCQNRKSSLENSQELLEFTLQYYADTVVDTGLNYSKELVANQLPVTNKELGARGVSNLKSFLKVHWQNLGGYMDNGRVSRKNWLDACKAI